MTRVLVGLILGATLASGVNIVAADEPSPKKLTPEERKELQARWKELTSAGDKYYETRKLTEATETYAKALAVARRLYPATEFPDGHPDLAASLNELAVVLRVRSKLADAEPLSRAALEMRRRLHSGQDHPDLAESLNNLAIVLRARAKYTDAEPLYREVLEMNRRLFPKQDHLDLARSLNNLASVLNARGKYSEAERLYRDALEMNRRLFPKQDHPLLALSLNNLANVLQTLGKYADAETLYREALEMRRRLYPRQDQPNLAVSLTNLASVLRAQGQYAGAESLCQEALEMRRRLFPNQDHPDLALSLNNLAGILQEQGKLTGAEPLYRDALEMHRRLYPGQDHPSVATSLNNLAGVLGARGKYADAEALFRDALEMHRGLFPGQDHPQLALSMDNLATVLHAGGKLADAEPLFRDALRMYRALAGAYAAERSEGDALTLAASYPLARDGFLSTARARLADPKTVYPEVWASKANLARVYERRALAARAASADPRAAALLAQLTDRRRRRADLLLAPKPADPTSLKKRNDDLDAYSGQIEALDRALRPLLPAVDRAETLARATPADLQKALPPNTAVVDFLRYTLFEQDPNKPGKAGEKRIERFLAFVLTRDKITWSDLGPAEPIEDAVAAWRQAITGGKDILAALPAKVRELAWARVRQEIPDGVRMVYVCPDLALCRVPWAALPGDKPGTILLEDHAVAVLPHAVFLLDKLGPQDPLPIRAAGILVVGGVAYDAETVRSGPLALNRGDLLLKPDQKVGWMALPAAAAEARGVAGAATGKKLAPLTLGEEKASASAVLAALPRARYAHLATHGFFADPSFRSAFQVDPKLFETTWRGERVGAGALSPLVMTGLVFAGANRPDTPGRGVVTGEALVDLDLSGLELAVLSACETGLGDVAGGEGTFGLQRAFHLAGTRDVVASLWKVPDRATAALMALFYRNLWDKNMTPIEALRQAQLEIYRHPEKVPELAAGFRGKFAEVPGSTEVVLSPGPDGKARPRMWAAFTLSGPGR